MTKSRVRAGAGAGDGGGQAGGGEQGGHQPLLSDQGHLPTQPLHIHLAQAARGIQPTSTGRLLNEKQRNFFLSPISK